MRCKEACKTAVQIVESESGLFFAFGCDLFETVVGQSQQKKKALFV